MTTRQKFRWLDPVRKMILTTDGATCPPGCSPFTGGPVPTGYAVQTSFALMDGAPVAALDSATVAHLRAMGAKVVAGLGKHTPVNDAAGPSPLMDGDDFLTDVLASAPASTRGLRDKATRLMLDAENATGGTLDNALYNLNAVARYYAAQASRVTDGAEKAACIKAADAITGFCRAKEVMRNVG